MSKIVAAVRGTPSQKIEHERRAIAAVEAEIADMEQQRAAKLLDDDLTEAIKLGQLLTTARARLATHEDRLKAFQSQARRAATDRRKQQKAEALAVFEKLFGERAVAATRITSAIVELGAALKAYRAAARAPFEPWPDVFPDLRLFRDSAYSNIDSRIGGNLNMRSPGDAHALLTNLPIRLGDLAEGDILLGAALVESIKSSPLPPQHDTEDEAA